MPRSYHTKMNQLAKDAKELAKIKFDDLPSEDDWASIQSKIE